MDDIDLIMAIEQSFQVEFEDAQVSSWSTVGDIHEALLAKLAPSEAVGRCVTSMAFYRVRSALVRETGTRLRVRPDTRLSALTRMSPRRLFRALSRELGVEGGPAFSLSPLGWLILASLPVIFLVSGVLHNGWMLLLLPLGLGIVAIDPGAYYAETVGGVARQVAAQNYSHFTALGADGRPPAVWNALCALIESETDFPAKNVRADTRLVAPD